MSGVVKAVGKVFKGVAKAVTGAVKWIGNNWQYVALAAAAVYTGGLAAGAWGAVGGSAAVAGEAGATAAEIGGGAAAAGGAMTAGEAAAAMATPGLEALGAGAATVGASADIATAAMMATPGLEAIGAGSSIAASGGELGTGAFSGLLGNMVTQGPDAAMTSATNSWWDPNKSFMGNVSSDVTHAAKSAGNYLFGGSSSGGAGAAGGAGGAGGSGGISGLLGSYAKTQLLSTGLQMLGAYEMNKPRAPQNYSGYTPGGGGGGIGMHTINNGFGLAAGGTEPAPSGVPNALIPNNTPWGGNAGGTAPGASLSNSGLKSAAQQPGNIGQAAANQVGVGGLIPQGAVNYMGGGNG